MADKNTETTEQTTGPTNPMVNQTLGTLLEDLQYTSNQQKGEGTPATLTGGWNSQLTAAQNPAYAAGVGGAMTDFADVAAGKRFGQNDPGYAALRAKAGDDTLRDINALTTASGRFGSGSHIGTATEALGNVYAGMDYQNYQQDIARQQNAAQMLPQIFAAGQAPGSVQAGVGQQMQQQPWYNLGQASSILAGTSGAGGQTSTTTTPSTPWWQTGIGLAGQFI